MKIRLAMVRCDKPFVDTLEKAKELVALAKKHKIPPPPAYLKDLKA